MSLDIIGFLKDGKYRIKVLKELNKSPLLPSELSKKLNIHRTSVSRILRIMREKGLVSATSSESRTIIYNISEKGKHMLEKLK